jgi:hypothetical protein
VRLESSFCGPQVYQDWQRVVIEQEAAAPRAFLVWSHATTIKLRRKRGTPFTGHIRWCKVRILS